ncbi:unnamed protein product [Oppiella nova]|uniref:Uncharacterized protein n=1 Tax=Oppiella nova TaxID=334625 RepID=A0A7R9QM35_9ACAR|nr:unnamed protein product [Oppiella nova]CAG2167732.1 unnamed protein product [Oppiella nova]
MDPMSSSDSKDFRSVPPPENLNKRQSYSKCNEISSDGKTFDFNYVNRRQRAKTDDDYFDDDDDQQTSIASRSEPLMAMKSTVLSKAVKTSETKGIRDDIEREDIEESDASVMEFRFKSNESSVHRVTQGFNFQIWSVLLSLGILTKLEYDLREELSQIFNACIHVRRCLYRNADSMNENQSLKCNVWDVLRWKSSPKVCVSKWKHKNTEYNSRRVVVVNVLFAMLAITHLAYLGSTFDGKEECLMYWPFGKN